MHLGILLLSALRLATPGDSGAGAVPVGACFAVHLGSWVPARAWGGDSIYTMPPRGFRVATRRGGTVRADRYALRALAGAAGPVLDRGEWVAISPDSAQVLFGTGFSGVLLTVRRYGAGWRGIASPFWDFPRTRQTAPVTLTRVACGEAPHGGGAPHR